MYIGYKDFVIAILCIFMSLLIIYPFLVQNSYEHFHLFFVLMFLLSFCEY